MTDIKKKLKKLREELDDSGTGISYKLHILIDVLLTVFEYAIEIEEEGKGDPEL